MIENKKIRIPLFVVFCFFTLAVMFVIFRFSCDTGEQSAEVSETLLTKIIAFIGSIISENFLRKTAHFSEFAALGFFMAGTLYFLFNKRNVLIPLVPCILYAISDEVHQYFVPDRACRVFDVFIDTCGSALGIAVFILIVVLITKHKEKNDGNSKKQRA